MEENLKIPNHVAIILDGNGAFLIIFGFVEC